MKIYVKQIDESSLTAFVTGAAGSSLSGQLNSYLQNGGYLGVNVVYTSGGTQIISGNKIFDASPNVPYSGGTGTAPSRLYVDNQITLAGASTQLGFSGLSGTIFNTGAALSSVKVTGSSGIQVANFTGLGNVSVSIISGGLIGVSGNSNDAINLSGRLVATGAALSAISITGDFMRTPNFTGMGGTLVIRSGNFVLISGGAGGGSVGNGDGINLSGRLTATGAILVSNDLNLSGSLNASGRRAWDDATNLSGRLFATGAALSAVSITGDFVQTPNFSGMGGTLIIRSGNFVLISGAGAGVGGGSNVSVTGSNTISSPNLTGINGTLVIQSGNFVLISGNSTTSQFIENNTFNITGTGAIYITNLASGSQNNTYNVSGVLNNNPLILNGITGNFVNLSFFYDATTLATGLNSLEAFVSREFTFTGFALGAYITGTHGFMSGSIYQRDIYNTKQKVADFSLQSGSFFTGVGGFSRTISGMSRVGLDIFRLLTGATGVSIGVFGVGY